MSASDNDKAHMQYSSDEPETTGILDVGEGQSIYWEMFGPIRGDTAVFLHGGPGSGCGSAPRRYFDRTGIQAVLFDQRGCGRSRPLATGPEVDLSVNTTDHMVRDLERLRTHLGIERWIVVGVSWGVTLALVYAMRNPERVAAMVLGAVTTGTPREIQWITHDMGRLFPKEWEEFVSVVPNAERGPELCAAYAGLLADPDAAVRDRASIAWCRWEDTHVSLMPGWEPSERYKDPVFRSVFARLVTHYWSHGCFLADGEIMSGLPRIAHIPAVLIHGRWDISGPIDTAWKLHQLWPASELQVLEGAGHGGPGFSEAMTEAINRFRQGLLRR